MVWHMKYAFNWKFDSFFFTYTELYLGWEQIDILFGSKPCNEMREAAQNLTRRLAQTAEETFGDFEEAVEKDATKTAVLDGTVHPLTSYVINYVKFLFE